MREDGTSVSSLDPNDEYSAASGFEGRQPAVALVCIHGLAGSSAWWNTVTAELEEAGPVYPLDLPRGVHPADLAVWVIEQLNRFPVDGPVDFMGHSLGALVALRVAAARPELVRKLVLIAPPGMMPGRSTVTFGWPLIASLTRARPSFLARLAADASRAGPANILRGARHVAAADARLDARKVAAPTLLVWGATDRLVPRTSADQWLEALANARLHVIPTASHVPMVEAPNELVTVIGDFRNER
jgi:pimeloyl-ACP methyl ester carboxylesterase